MNWIILIIGILFAYLSILAVRFYAIRKKWSYVKEETVTFTVFLIVVIVGVAVIQIFNL